MPDDIEKGIDEIASKDSVKRIEKLFAEEKAGNAPKVSSAFQKALITLLPAIGGAVFGGAKGAAAGIQAGSAGAVNLAGEEIKAQQAQADRKAEFNKQRRTALVGAIKQEDSQQRSEQTRLAKLKISQAEAAIEKKDKEKPLTESVAKARKFSKQAEIAEAEYIKGLKDTGFVPGGGSETIQELFTFATPKALEGLVTTEGFQSARNAESNFINASLRDDSGAALKDEEIEEAKISLFPRPGNSARVIAQKSRMRKALIDALKEKGRTITQSEAAGLLKESLSEIKNLDTKKSNVPTVKPKYTAEQIKAEMKRRGL